VPAVNDTSAMVSAAAVSLSFDGIDDVSRFGDLLATQERTARRFMRFPRENCFLRQRPPRALLYANVGHGGMS
jgi:hypothetical protein